ncbi:MAG: hypothetical protein HY049_02090 [Acidobacteria bacterium]|nr:hypothetical protein [Acidobacteriota bacterium]
MRRFRNVRLAFALVSSLFGMLGLAAAGSSAAADVAGDWVGVLDTGHGSLHVVIHVTDGKDGSLSATMDSPDQGVTGLVITSITYAAPDLAFGIEKQGFAYAGKFDHEKEQIAGTWKQGGASLPLTFARAGK